PSHAGLGGKAAHMGHARGAIGLEICAADGAVAGEEWEDVVAVRALVLALVDLDQVPEAEEALEQRPVPQQIVEWAEENGRCRVAVELRLGVDVERWAAVVDGH